MATETDTGRRGETSNVSWFSTKLGRRLLVERLTSRWLLLAALFATGLFVVIVATLVTKSSMVLSQYSLWNLLVEAEWNPGRDSFGFFPAIVGTVYVTGIAMAISVPISVLAALYVAEYTRGRLQTVLTSFVDVLAAIPSVVFGLFGLIVVVPFVDEFLAPAFGADSTGVGIVTAGLVLAIMVFPIIISLSVESLNSLPVELRESALALGDTKWGVTRRVLLRGAGPGVISAVLLGLGRAIGATIAIAMLIGGQTVVPSSPFDAGQTLPSLIVSTFGEMMSIPLTQSALIFAALILLVIVTLFNLLATVLKTRFERRWSYQ